MAEVPSSHRMLSIYLNNHLAGAEAGTRRARRIADAHPGPDQGEALRQLAADIACDAASLRRVMRELGVRERRPYAWLGRVGELAGLVKPNGAVLRRSPLTDLVELEALRLGVLGKRQLWAVLADRFGADSRVDRSRLDELVERADRQAHLLEELRLRAAGVLTPRP
ncbi:hypothetical protein K353_03556 [Kitasatospora sp. SolWspMP-SS2h]|uniref:hypothetical protein n=1 Tax=Kitasatospora sp. SolWspMP-SS2h TaxID=1305729 RepID=UPI000DBA673A|nr:hypothetical protein [Kitasatospora sp. SolWspMP-SS2h]RAJ40068.1 hypothetical protein K353_03556 [Kitasatospora sp. SolWspMP-SS2h]